MAGILAGVAGNIDSMKMLKAFRLLDIRFPKSLVQSFPSSIWYYWCKRVYANGERAFNVY